METSNFYWLDTFSRPNPNGSEKVVIFIVSFFNGGGIEPHKEILDQLRNVNDARQGWRHGCMFLMDVEPIHKRNLVQVRDDNDAAYR